MSTATPARSVLRFDDFELDLKNSELRKAGTRIKLQPQPFRVLGMLANHANELVSRDEIRKAIWGQETFVDFEQGLNYCIKQIRVALADDAETPRYVETVPRLGYRFIARVEVGETSPVITAAVQPDQTEAIPARRELASLPGLDSSSVRPKRQLSRWVILTALVVTAAVMSLVLALKMGGWQSRLLQPANQRIQSLAVLPLENLSGDKEQEYFADGMTDTLITNLAALHELRVISRTSTMLYKNVKKPLPQIGRELNVDGVLEGSVLRSGGRVRINVQLLHAATDRHLWAKTYDADLRDVFTVQNQLARDITDQIRVELTRGEHERLARRRPTNPDANEDYLKGRFFFNKRTEEGLRQAVRYFDEATQKDSTYAEAYAGLADSYALLGEWFMPGQDAWQDAKSDAEKALEIDPGLGEAHASLGLIAMVFEWDWHKAEQEFRRALELNPGYATAHHWYGYYLMATGRFDEAEGELKRAQELDPLSLVIDANIGFRLYCARRYDEAIEQWHKTLRMDPNFPLVHSYLAMAYEQQHLYPAAVEEFEKAFALGGSPTDMAALGHVYGLMGKTEQARKQLQLLNKFSKRTFVPAFYIAYVYVGLGDADQAFRWLDKACKEHSGPLIDLKVDPSFDHIRSDPRFEQLLHRLNFPS